LPSIEDIARLGSAFVLMAVAAPAFAGPSAAVQTPPPGGLTAEELAAEPTGNPAHTTSPASYRPISAKHASDVEIEAVVDFGYFDENGTYVIDLLQRDHAYVAVRLQTPEGRPVEGAVPSFSIEGTSQFLGPEEIAAEPASNIVGVVEFAIVAGEMGLDRLTVSYGDASTEILINVVSLEAAGFPVPPAVEGGIPWEELLRARIRFEDTLLMAEFPAAVSERAGQTVKLSGFMMPLEPELRQRRFLLTSTPPSCFFHVPGGPAGAVEVLAEEGIELSWDPVVLEGRFEPQRASDVGVVYRLHDARLVDP
jgi:hypothetical protein